jgi:hypothetical protein
MTITQQLKQGLMNHQQLGEEVSKKFRKKMTMEEAIQMHTLITKAGWDTKQALQVTYLDRISDEFLNS